MVRDVAFAPHPLRLITSGPGGPQHALMGLMLVTLAPGGLQQIPRVLSVEEPLVTVRRGLSFFVDCAASLLPASMQIISATGSSLGIRIGSHSRSPGSSADLPRVRFEVLVQPSAASELDLERYLQSLRISHLESQVLIASRGLYTDGDAFLLDLSSAAALLKVWPLCQEALFLTSHLATVRTVCQQEDWQVKLDAIWDEDQEAAISKIRWRPSRLGGRVWASPASLVAQGPRVRRVPQSEQRGSAGMLTAEVQLAGSLGYDPDDVVAKLIEVLHARGGLQLSHVTPGALPQADSWRRVADLDPTAAPGLVRLYLADPDALRMLHREFDGRAVQYGEDLVEVRVLTQLEQLRPSGNRRGGG